MAVVHINDGSRLRVQSREHWLIGPEYLYIVIGRAVHHVAFRNIASIAIPGPKASRRREKAG